MEPYEVTFSPDSSFLVEDINGAPSTLAAEDGGISIADKEASPSLSCNSPGVNVPIVTSTIEAGSSGGPRDPRRRNQASNQAWMYYTCPKNCGFNSRNKERFENHLKNCGLATSKKVETSLHATPADRSIPDKSVVADVTVEPIKILTCPRCGYKSSKKARMDIHNCQPITQLKPKDSVPEEVAAKKMEPVKQPKPSKPTQPKVKEVSAAPEVAAKKEKQTKQQETRKSTQLKAKVSPVPEVPDAKKKEETNHSKPTTSATVALPRLKCSLCGFCTGERKYLVHHEKMHVVKSQFQCPHCTYSVGKQGHLARHTSRDHPELQKPNDASKLPNVEPSKEQPLQDQVKELLKEMKERSNPKPQRKVSLKVSAPKDAPRKECAPKNKSSRNDQLPNAKVPLEPFSGLDFQPPDEELLQDFPEPEKADKNSQQLPTEEFLKEPKETSKSKESASDEKKKETSPRKDSSPKDAPLEVKSPKKKRKLGRPSVVTEKVFQCPQCEFSCEQSANYKVHEASHKRKGQFKCNFCTYSAVQQFYVDTHMKRYHQNASKVLVKDVDPPKEKKESAKPLVLVKDVDPPKEKKESAKPLVLVKDVDPPKENEESAKPLVMIPMDQLEDLNAAEDAGEELPDLGLDYFQELEDTFATFDDGPITPEVLEDLVEKTKENAAKLDLDASEVEFVENIALVASALYETFASIREIAESGTFNDEKLVTMKIELEEKEYRARMNSKEISKLSDQQDSIQSKIAQLGDAKVKAEMVVNRLEFDVLQLKLKAKQSARAQEAYQDALVKVRRFKDRVCSLDEELVKAEEEAGLLEAELEEVEKVNYRDKRSLMMLKEEVEEFETSVVTGQVSAESRERMKELQETGVKQRRALCILHDQLIKLTYIKMMKKIDAEEEMWLEFLDKA